MLLEDVVHRVNSFVAEAHKILAVHEAAPSRTVLLDNSYNELHQLSLKQDELLRQALRCVENKLYRAAHILCWVALMDFLEAVLNFNSLDELREKVSEFQIIKACKDLKLINRNEMRVLHGFLSKRNLCAHPSDFFPDYNQTLGYVADILNTIKGIQNRIVP